MVGCDPLKAGVLSFQLAKASELLFTYAGILVFPVVKGCRNDVVRTADFGHSFAKVLRFENVENLLL